MEPDHLQIAPPPPSPSLNPTIYRLPLLFLFSPRASSPPFCNYPNPSFVSRSLKSFLTFGGVEDGKAPLFRGAAWVCSRWAESIDPHAEVVDGSALPAKALEEVFGL